MADKELSAEEIAALDARMHDAMRRRIERQELLFDARRWEFYLESNGALLPKDEQGLLMGWYKAGVIQLTNKYSPRKCTVTLTAPHA